jgi:surfeit locus 1 family protein
MVATHDHDTHAPRRGLLWPTVLALVGLAVLLSLGTWQLQRKAWKDSLIAAIAARTTASSVTLDDVRRRWAGGEDIEYTRVLARGRFLHDKERFVYAPGLEGPGFHVYTPLETDQGAIVFVNRGFVPERLKDRTLRPGGAPHGEVEVVGLVRRPGEKSWFTPDQGAARDVWYWRDLDGMAASVFGNSGKDIVPFFVEAEARSDARSDWPRGGATRLALPNRHLEYAVTWYGLALTLIGVYLAFAITQMRRR